MEPSTTGYQTKRDDLIIFCVTVALLSGMTSVSIFIAFMTTALANFNNTVLETPQEFAIHGLIGGIVIECIGCMGITIILYSSHRSKLKKIIPFCLIFGAAIVISGAVPYIFYLTYWDMLQQDKITREQYHNYLDGAYVMGGAIVFVLGMLMVLWQYVKFRSSMQSAEEQP